MRLGKGKVLRVWVCEGDDAGGGFLYVKSEAVYVLLMIKKACECRAGACGQRVAVNGIVDDGQWVL